VRRRSAFLGLVLALGACRADVGQPRADASAPVPARGALNPFVLAALRAYPADGTHGYWWPKEGPWRGTTKTLAYEDATLCEGDARGRCHCSGLTFEVFLVAWFGWARAHGHPERVADLDLAGMRRFQDRWYGTDGDRRTLRTALVEGGLGAEVPHAEAEPGDFVQLWRHDGSGHSAVFLRWERDAAGAVTGLRYWSTQASTNGIGERSESFGDAGRSVDRAQTWVVRVGR
jgi:hypothetical protein